jgi:hypothetical protein
MDNEQIRQLRKERAERRAAKYLKWAESAERKSEAIDKSLEPYSDWAFISEPIKIGHHSEGRHRRLRERISRRMDAQYELRKKAGGYRQKAENILKFGTRVKGDAEQARQKERDEADRVIAVGSKVKDFCFGLGIVTRVNKKTYSIRFSSGGTYARDKSFIRPISGESADLSKNQN